MKLHNHEKSTWHAAKSPLGCPSDMAAYEPEVQDSTIF